MDLFGNSNNSINAAPKKNEGNFLPPLAERLRPKTIWGARITAQTNDGEK
jgi:hypothetical protein